VDEIAAKVRHYRGMAGKSTAPNHGALVEDLLRLRSSGLTGMRRLRLPALGPAAMTVTADRGLDQAPAVEQTLRQAIERLDVGEYGEAATLLFGLALGTRARSAAERRTLAGRVLSRSADTFARRYEANLIADVADSILSLLADQRLRETRTQLERRHPAESRLAVQWIERFEAYYRIWTPVWGIGADLTAYRSTLLEPGRPYDRDPGTLAADDPGYTQESQAEGYARFALYRYAWYQWEIHQFVLKHGGMWLLSTGEAETRVQELNYELDFHVLVFNERDLSWLRRAVAESREQDMGSFLGILSNTTTGEARWEEWLQWCQLCHCTWDVTTEATTEDGYFPTSDTESGISTECRLHLMVKACGQYCDTIDTEWRLIADWYHMDDPLRRGKSDNEVYRRWRLSEGR
jgi:hypothetical protein